MYSFTHSPSFDLNEWIYLGVSFYRTNRIEGTYDIHIVSKSDSGTSNTDSILSQDLELPISPLRYIKSFGNYKEFFEMSNSVVIGEIADGEKIKFTGMSL